MNIQRKHQIDAACEFLCGKGVDVDLDGDGESLELFLDDKAYYIVFKNPNSTSWTTELDDIRIERAYSHSDAPDDLENIKSLLIHL